jgi:hypothetical protein
MQSATVPLQGFLNSIVYGRTRDDFVQMMGTTGQFYNRVTEEDSSRVHVIDYSSEYAGDTVGSMDSGGESPTLLLDSAKD